jgi:uncharacterized membrane protein
MANWMSHRINRRDERGAVLVLATVGFVLAMISASLAVDLGVLAADKRTDQKIADLAALDASRDLDGVTAHCSPPPTASGPFCPAVISASRNFSANDADTTISAERVSPNAAGDWVADPAGSNVRVTVSSPRKPYFPFVGSDSRTVTAKAVAGAGNAIGTVRVGSRLASLSGNTPSASTEANLQVLMLNKTISALIGGNYSTDLVGWRGLADSSVTFGALTSSLGTLTGNGTFTAGTPEEVLDSTFTMGQLLTAMTNVLNNSGNSSAATRVAGINSEMNSATHLDQPLKLRRFFDFGGVVVGNKQDVANATLNVLDMIRGGAIVANGDHFASFELTKAQVPMPAVFNGATVSMGLIEAPQIAEGSPGKRANGTYYTHARTSQIRVKLDVKVRTVLSSALTATVGVGLTAVTTQLLAAGSPVDATFSYYLDAGTAHAYLDAMRCGASAEPTGVDIWGVTDIGTSKLGLVSGTALGTRETTPNPTNQTVVVGLAGLVNVKTTSVLSTTIPGNSGVMRTFLPAYDGVTSQEVPGTTVSLPAVTSGSLTVEPAVVGLNASSLIGDLVVAINATTNPALPNAPGAPTSILKPLYNALGLSFGSADLWAPQEQTCAAVSLLPVQQTNTPVLKG